MIMQTLSLSKKNLINEITQKAKVLKNTYGNLTIGEMIKMIRVYLKMTQRILAQKAKIPQTTICRAENNSGNLKFETLNKIFNALFCDLIIA